jgi:hypothetical protein
MLVFLDAGAPPPACAGSEPHRRFGMLTLMALIVDAGDDPCEFSGLITLRL